MHRRTLVAAAGAIALPSLAGCLHSGDDPASVVEAWYEELSALDSDAGTEAALAAVDDLLHTQSPIRGAIGLYVPFLGDRERAGTDGEGADSDGVDLSSLETDVVARDIGADRIRQEFLFFQEGREELLEELAAENAVIRATVEWSTGETETQDWLVVTEDGDWTLFG